MSFFALSSKNDFEPIIAYTIGPPPISYELIPDLIGINQLPFDLYLKEVSSDKKELTIKKHLSSASYSWLDYLPNCLAWPLMSEKMFFIVQENLSGNENIDWITVTVQNASEHRNHYIPRFLSKLDVLDEEKTTYVAGTDHIIIPYFSEAKLKKYHMFHKPVNHSYAWQITSGLYIDEFLKNALELGSISGISFDKISDSRIV